MANEILKTLSINGVSMDAPKGLSTAVVASLPQTGEEGIIYFVANGGSAPSAYDEYIWVDSAFEQIGGSGGGGGTSAEMNDVNFYDYDGTIVASYSAADFAGLSELPENPSHTGLVAQGWNWSLADAKAYVADYGMLEIGQMYETESGKTEIDIVLTGGRLSPILVLGVNGTVTIEWGDGTSSTATGTNINTSVYTQHTYASPGEYTISINSNEDNVYTVSGYSGYGCLISATSAGSANIVYPAAVCAVRFAGNVHKIGTYAFIRCSNLKNVTLGQNIQTIGNYAFQYCYNLRHITLPSSMLSVDEDAFRDCPNLSSVSLDKAITSIGKEMFYNDYSLKRIAVPDQITTLTQSMCYNCVKLSKATIPASVRGAGNSVFSGCTLLESLSISEGITVISQSFANGCGSLREFTIPNSVTSINTYALTSCIGLRELTIPSGVTTIATKAFRYCYGMDEIHLLPQTPPTLDNADAFNGIPSDCIIYVPAASLEAYQTATNWSTYASQMQGE